MLRAGEDCRWSSEATVSGGGAKTPLLWVRDTLPSVAPLRTLTQGGRSLHARLERFVVGARAVVWA
jgi:hypothetical protein